MTVLLSIKHLKTYYYTLAGVVRAVDGVDLEIEKSEALGLVGESGCGKSTVALSIMRLVRPPGKIIDGEIIFEGEDLLKKNPREMERIRGRKISMIFQNPSSALNPVFTVGSQIAEAIMTHMPKSREINVDEKVIDLLKKVGIPDPIRRRNQYPHEYSMGMQQRAMIAMALACNPLLLIADEPTTSLDLTIQAQIIELLKLLLKESGSSLLLITHDLGLVAELCNKVAIMYAGKIVEYSDVITIFKKALHPYTRALLRAVPRLDEDIEEFYTIKGEVPSPINPPSGCRFHPRCPFRMPKCDKEEPKLTEINKGHKVACWYLET